MKTSNRCWFGFLLIALQACGYQFSGSPSLPGDVNHVAIHVLANRTRQSGLEVIVTNALIGEFSKHGQGLVVDTDRAQAVLTGTIRFLNLDVETRSSTMIVVTRRVTLVVALTLADKTGKVLWRDDSIRASQNYAVTGNEISDQGNRLDAIRIAVQRLAENVYLELAQNF